MMHFKRRGVDLRTVQSVRSASYARVGLNMKSMVVAALCAAAVLAAPQNPQDQQATIVRQDSQISPDGSFVYSYETSNGIVADATGQQQGPESLSVQGRFSYYSPDGTPIELQYLADSNGFQPRGAHLPTPPPVPEAIQRSIEYNAAHPEEDESQGGGQGFDVRQGGQPPRRQG